MNPLILFFEEIQDSHFDLVGGKAFSLGKLQSLKQNIKVPEGFVLTTEFYKAFLELTGIKKEVYKIFGTIDVAKTFDLQQKSEEIRALFYASKFPQELVNIVLNPFYKLKSRFDDSFMVAVRSSATTEDLEVASFAGQFDTFLCVGDEDELIGRIRGCLAGLFNARAISYRVGRKISEESVLLGIVIQRMIRADRGASGVMFSLDTETGFDKVVYINSIYGFGELLVGGKVNPDSIYVFKDTLLQGKRPIIDKKCGFKQEKLIYRNGSLIREQVPVTDREQFSISDSDALELARQCIVIEKAYGRHVDVEWAKDDNGIYIVQARPETVHGRKQFAQETEIYELKELGEVICEGEPVGSKIGAGRARVVLDIKEITHFEKGEVLVTAMTDPDMEPYMKIASAVVTDRGGRTCHAAIITRELGIPCVIGTSNATQIINTGDNITVDCSSGVGKVYKGLLNYSSQKVPVNIPKTRTKIMMNVGMPDKAFQYARIPNDGVGLARIEFIISSIGIHPLALINFETLKEQAVLSSDPRVADAVIKIEQRTKRYPNKTHYFINNLARGIGKIAAAFWPNDVIVRLSDFKTNEYASLIGGHLYEPDESNPMIGWRGASRYYDPKFKPAFGLECRAVKKVREEFGLTNVKVMVPFCRTPDEGKKVIETMKEFGLIQGENGLEIYVMCEIPSNVLLASQFAEIFDGFSIGSNDLTQLTLGLDRDSQLISHLYDERNEAIKLLVSQVIDIAHRHNRKIGICGQAPSDFPDFAEFLVECGIDSVSLNPDTVLKTRLLVAEKEKQRN